MRKHPKAKADKQAKHEKAYKASKHLNEDDPLHEHDAQESD